MSDIVSFLSGHDLLAVWNVIPEGVKRRLGQCFDRLGGYIGRRWDRADKKKDAEITVETKKEDNKADIQKDILAQLVPDIAKKISADPELLERAMVETMGEAYKKQQNKDAVAGEAMEELARKHADASESSEPLDEDWLNVFSGYAEKASTERTRQLWGRILSGEVRHPGRFSLSALRVLSEIDQKTAQCFVDMSVYVFSNHILFSENFLKKYSSELLLLEEVGLINGLDGHISIVVMEEGNEFTIDSRDFALKINASVRDKLTLTAIKLTKVGMDLINIIDIKENKIDFLNDIEEILKEKKFINKYSIFPLKNEGSETLISSVPVVSWTR